jgi:hypothetical protein
MLIIRPLAPSYVQLTAALSKPLPQKNHKSYVPERKKMDKIDIRHKQRNLWTHRITDALSSVNFDVVMAKAPVKNTPPAEQLPITVFAQRVRRLLHGQVNGRIENTTTVHANGAMDQTREWETPNYSVVSGTNKTPQPVLASDAPQTITRVLFKTHTKTNQSLFAAWTSQQMRGQKIPTYEGTVHLRDDSKRLYEMHPKNAQISALRNPLGFLETLNNPKAPLKLKSNSPFTLKRNRLEELKRRVNLGKKTPMQTLLVELP